MSGCTSGTNRRPALLRLRTPSSGNGVVSIPLLALAGLALVGVGCGGVLTPDGALTANTSDHGAAEDRWRVRRGDFAERLVLTGELAAEEGVQIAVPRTPSWQVQIRWLVEDGTRVEVGDRILDLDNSSFTSDLEETRSKAGDKAGELVHRRASLAADEADARFTVEQRRADLRKAELKAAVPADLVARRDVEERQLALRKAELALAKAEADLKAKLATAAAELAQIELDLASQRREIAAAEQAIQALSVTTPAAGVVLVADHPWERRKIEEGDRVYVGLVVATIPDVSKMTVRASLSDVDHGRLATGQEVECVVDAYPDSPFGGRVTALTPVAREAGRGSLRRFFAVAIAPEPGARGSGALDPERLRPGMSVKVVVRSNPRPAALLAPRAGLDLAAAPPRARLADGGWAAIAVGPCNAGECVVESGLDEGTLLASADIGGDRS